MADEITSANTETSSTILVPTAIDFSRINLEFHCVEDKAAKAVQSGLNKLKGLLESFTSAADGVFSAGSGIGSAIGSDIASISTSAKNALGELETNVISLREQVASAILTWKLEGEEAATDAFNAIKNSFPSYDPSSVLEAMSGHSGNTVLIFSLCDTVKEQTIADGRTTPLDIPEDVPAPSGEALPLPPQEDIPRPNVEAFPDAVILSEVIPAANIPPPEFYGPVEMFGPFVSITQTKSQDDRIAIELEKVTQGESKLTVPEVIKKSIQSVAPRVTGAISASIIYFRNIFSYPYKSESIRSDAGTLTTIRSNFISNGGSISNVESQVFAVLKKYYGKGRNSPNITQLTGDIKDFTRTLLGKYYPQ